MAEDVDEHGLGPADLKLKTLRPVYEEDKHGLYVDLLVRDLTSGAPSQNIAVSGAYGSGKSSVLAGLLTKLKDKSVESIQISLATLNQSRKAILEVSGEATLTAALEKEVVKRLLYSAKPSTIPRSRFKRIVGFRSLPAAGFALTVGLLVTGVAATFDVSLPMEQLVAVWHWKRWLGPVLDALSVGGLAFVGQAAMSSFRVSQVAVGPATVALDDKDSNDFDRYLDEIVYFFERTKTRVVAFEDLDRFDDPGIFLALRELNNLLNSSGQISQQVSFVYAIRDSLFVKAIESVEIDVDEPESIDESAKHEGASDVLALPDAHARHGVDSAASDRAKFFDLIVPIVPFISHEVAADLLVTALVDLPDELQPSRELATLAGRHFADMRVIHSIRNEYEVFAAELLKKSRVQGLSADQLFAMILYKHLYLDDFERIRTGESKLDAAADRIRGAVADLVSAVDTAIATVDDAIQAGHAVDRRAKAAGERLLTLLDATLRIQRWNPVQALTIVGAKQFARDDVPRRDFWATLAASDDPALQVHSNGAFDIAGPDVALFLGGDRNPKAWTRSEVQRDRQRLEQLNVAREWVRHATFAELLAGPYPAVKLGDDQLWTQARDACIDEVGDGLLFDLLRLGFIDQNFSLYTTKFHGAILSARARTYLMQYVDRHRSDPHFELSGDDVDEILARRGDSLLSDESSLNLAIVDRLLEKRAQLPAALEESERAEDFLVTYLADGRFGDQLLERLTESRRDILDVVASASKLSESDRRRGLNTCLSVLAGGGKYGVSSTTAELLAGALESMPAFETELKPETAAAVAELVASNDLVVEDLQRVHESLRGQLAEAGCFAITRANLEAITRAPGVGLDTVGETAEGAATYLISNMSEYLAAIQQEPAGTIVDDPTNFDQIVRAIVENAPEDLAAALAFRPSNAMYANLALAPAEGYGDLARASAFPVTRENISQYVDTVGAVDADLASLLERAGAIEVNESEVGTDEKQRDAEEEAEEQEHHDADEESQRQRLAKLIVTSDHLQTDVKIQIVVSLQTSSTLDVDELNLTDPKLAAGLLRECEIADNLATFTTLASAPWPVFEASASVSKHLPSFIGEIALTDQDLRNLLESGAVADVAKENLLGAFESFDPVLGAASATAWLAASRRLRVPLAPPHLARLAQAGAPVDQVLAYIERARPPMPSTDLVAVLAHCGQPYAGLATPNGSKFTVPFSESFRPVLQTLKDAGVVRSFHKKRLRDLADVQMAG